MQLGQHRLLRAGGDGAGRDRVARPGHHRGHHQQYIVAHAVLVDLGGFGRGFRLFDQHLVSADIGLRQMVQRGFERGVLPGLEQLRDGFGQLGFPEDVLDAAARAVERLGKRDQTAGVTGQAGSGLAAGTGHDFYGHPVSVQQRSLTPALNRIIAVSAVAAQAHGCWSPAGKAIAARLFVRAAAKRWEVLIRFWQQSMSKFHIYCSIKSEENVVIGFYSGGSAMRWPTLSFPTVPHAGRRARSDRPALAAWSQAQGRRAPSWWCRRTGWAMAWPCPRDQQVAWHDFGGFPPELYVAIRRARFAGTGRARAGAAGRRRHRRRP